MAGWNSQGVFAMWSVHDEEPEVHEDHEEQEPDEGVVQLRSFAVTEVLLLLVPLPGQGHPLGQGLATRRGTVYCTIPVEVLHRQERYSVLYCTRRGITLSGEVQCTVLSRKGITLSGEVVYCTLKERYYTALSGEVDFHLAHQGEVHCQTWGYWAVTTLLESATFKDVQLKQERSAISKSQNHQDPQILH